MNPKNINQLAWQMVGDDLSFQEVYEEIKRWFPESKFSKKCYYWYRNKLIKKGILISKRKAKKVSIKVVAKALKKIKTKEVDQIQKMADEKIDVNYLTTPKL